MKRKKPKIKELPENERKVVIGILRALLAKNGLAKKEGLERTEEIAVKLMDLGHLKIHFDKQAGLFWLKGTAKGKEFLRKRGLK